MACLSLSASFVQHKLPDKLHWSGLLMSVLFIHQNPLIPPQNAGGPRRIAEAAPALSKANTDILVTCRFCVPNR